MRKDIFLLYCLLFMFAFCSCRDASKKIVEKENDVVPKKVTIYKYNEKIQDTFFEVSFGDSPKVVKDKLESTSFLTFNKIFSNGEINFYIPKYNTIDSFPFGGFYWHILSCSFSNDFLYAIGFQRTFEIEEEAISNYNNVVKALSKKYYLQEVELPDNLTYGTLMGVTKNNQFVSVKCAKYVEKNHDIKYGVYLVYGDDNYRQENNEL